MSFEDDDFKARSERANVKAQQEQIRNAERQRVAMARGTLVLDENALMLQSAIKGRNIRVLTPPSGMIDDSIKSMLLANRILVTRNTKDFVDDASSFDYGIISLEHLKFLDPEPDPSKNQTVKLISKAIIDHGLWSLRHGFLVVLSDNGPSTFRALSD